MKQFEHEVLGFDASTQKRFKEMQTTLQHRGAAGFEIVSVVQTSMNSNTFMVFLKREILFDEALSSEVA